MLTPSALRQSTFGVLLCAAALAANAENTSCNAPARNSPGYAQAIEVVRQLPKLAAWSRTQTVPIAFGESFDKQERPDGHCYWSVSVYANRPERLELWHIFYVETNGKRLMVQGPISGDTISLQKWRAKGDKSRMA